MLIVGRFFVFEKWLGVARGGFLWVFLSSECLGDLCWTSLPVADNVHNSGGYCSEVVS